MNAIREPLEPMGGDLQCSESEYWHLLRVPLSDLVLYPLIEHGKPAFRDECRKLSIALQSKINLIQNVTF